MSTDLAYHSSVPKEAGFKGRPASIQISSVGSGSKKKSKVQYRVLLRKIDRCPIHLLIKMDHMDDAPENRKEEKISSCTDPCSGRVTWFVET
jgi:hypothetical protein